VGFRKKRHRKDMSRRHTLVGQWERRSGCGGELQPAEELGASVFVVVADKLVDRCSQ